MNRPPVRKLADSEEPLAAMSNPVFVTRRGRGLLLLPMVGLVLLLLLLPAASGFMVVPSPAITPSTAATAAAAAASSAVRARVPLPTLRIVWSNPMESQDYIRRIEGKEEAEKVDQPSVIIGAGTLGKALAEWGDTGQDVVLGRGEEIPSEIVLTGGGTTFTSFPIYVAVPEWEVEGVIQACPKDKRADLVFMQSACIESLLKRYGLCSKQQTQCVPYFGVSAIGRPMEGRVQYDVSKSDGEPKYAGETAVCGKWRGAVAERLQRKDLSCLVLDYTYWRKHMLERLIFDSVFSIVATVHGGKTYGELAQNHWAEIDDMVWELQRGMQGTLACALIMHVERRLRGIAEGERWRDRKPRLPAAQEYPFRNGFFRDIARAFTSRNFPSPFPTHCEYLNFAKETGMIDYEIDPVDP